MADGDKFPYVQDLDRRWHKRPTGDDWTKDLETQARTMCRIGVASVHVSQYDPRLQRYYADFYCRCLGRIKKEDDATRNV